MRKTILQKARDIGWNPSIQELNESLKVAMEVILPAIRSGKEAGYLDVNFQKKYVSEEDVIEYIRDLEESIQNLRGEMN